MVRGLIGIIALQVDGTLVARGTSTDSIRFTGFENPTYQQSSHGGAVTFGANAVNYALQYVVLDRMGDQQYYSGALQLHSIRMMCTLGQALIRPFSKPVLPIPRYQMRTLMPAIIITGKW